MDDDLSSLMRSVVNANDTTCLTQDIPFVFKTSSNNSIDFSLVTHKITSEASVDLFEECNGEISRRKRLRDEEVSLAQSTEAQATALDKLNIKIYHRFAATAQFKGVHDKVGQVAKWIVK